MPPPQAQGSGKALQGFFFGIENFEDLCQPGIIKDQPDLIGKVGEFQRSFFLLHGHVGGDDLADPVAVDKVNLGEIEEELSFSGRELFDDQLPERRRRFFRESDFARQIDDDDIILFSQAESLFFHLFPQSFGLGFFQLAIIMEISFRFGKRFVLAARKRSFLQGECCAGGVRLV